MENEKAETGMMQSAAADKIAVAETVAADLSDRVGGAENDSGADEDGAVLMGGIGADDGASGAAMALRDVFDPTDACDVAKVYAEVSEISDACEAVEPCDEVAEARPPDDLLLYAKEFASTAAGQLYLQMQKGDMRAIKLYYDLEERSRRAERMRDEGSGAERMARIAAVRRAVFGEAVMEEDRARALALAEHLALMDTEGIPAEVTEDDGDIAADDTEAETDV